MSEGMPSSSVQTSDGQVGQLFDSHPRHKKTASAVFFINRNKVSLF